MSGQKILIIEDEPSITETIRYALTTDGFEVDSCSTGTDGIERAIEIKPNLIILDIGLPDINGFEVFRAIHSKLGIASPIIFLTARAEEIDRVVGLELGADDYISKPFSPRELCARVRVILRRSGQLDNPKIAFPDSKRFKVLPDQFEIHYYGNILDLTPIEFRLLQTFIRQPQRVFSREELLSQCWDAPEHRLDRVIDTHIKTLRAKLLAVRPEEETIRTHRGLGYSLQPIS